MDNRLDSFMQTKIHFNEAMPVQFITKWGVGDQLLLCTSFIIPVLLAIVLGNVAPSLQWWLGAIWLRVVCVTVYVRSPMMQAQEECNPTFDLSKAQHHCKCCVSMKTFTCIGLCPTLHLMKHAHKGLPVCALNQDLIHNPPPPCLAPQNYGLRMSTTQSEAWNWWTF